MLRFVLGRAAGGKTYTILGLIEKCVNEGKRPLLLVPEQFSFESERAVLGRLGDIGAQSVSVVSFTRLCDELERLTGGMCGRVLSEPDKLILMGRAVASCAGELTVWRNYARSAGFARAMLDAVNEFKQNAVCADDLRRAAESAPAALADKLTDTANIFTAFNALVTERFIDPSDRLDVLYKKLEEHRFFENRPVFIDSFKGFTGQQYRILDRIIAQSRDVTVSFTDAPPSDELELFSLIRKTENRLAKTANAHHVEVAEPVVLSGNHYNSEGLSAVERLMAEDSCDSRDTGGAVTVCRAATVYDEAEFVARSIRKLVKEKNCRYGDIVVIARDTAPYEDALTAACRKNSVNCFTDRRIPLGSLPAAASVLAAVDAVRSISTERILRFHKTGLSLLDTEELSRLENYTYIWNIGGEDWERQWDMDPDGFNSGGELSERKKQTLCEINELRIRAVTPILNFKKSFCGNAAQMSGAIVKLLEECNAREALLGLCGAYSSDSRQIYADAVKQSWGALMQILDSLAACFGQADVKQSEYCEALRTAVSFTTVGVIPQMLDEVTFGAADRIRPSRPKYAFIMGANQGVFPKVSSSGGIFGNNERAQIIELGIDISDNLLESAAEEDFLVYTNVCCPTDGLFISYRTEIGGAAAQPSGFVGSIAENLDCIILSEPAAFCADNIPQTVESAFSEACRRMNSDSPDAATALKAVAQDVTLNERIEAVLSARAPKPAEISPETAERLFGKNITMSPSRLEEFNRCRFMYFCKNGLRARKLQPADFDAMQRGTLIHYVLQRLIERYGKGISELDGKRISDEVDVLINEYLDSIPGYRSVETPRSRYLVSTMSRSVKDVAERIALEFAQSEFEPVCCELKIGEGGDIPEIKIPVSEESSVSLGGIVDRLDSWNGYIRVVDYKTGHRDFKLPDILVGQNMQMLIYLYALCRSERFGGKPAGIFYMPARRAKDDSARDRRMSGIMQADIELVTAMERENKGQFIPRLGKTPNDNFVSAEDFDRIFSHIDRILFRTARELMSGDVKIDPVDGIGGNACKYCDFSTVCRIGRKPHRCAERLSNMQVMEQIAREDEENGI